LARPAAKDGIPEKNARESLVYKPPAWPEAPDTRGMLTRLALGTAFVLALCVGALVLGRRWLRKLPVASSTGGEMRVVETLSLGQRCRVHLVRVGRRRVLVGVDPSGVRAITPLPDLFEQALEEAEAEAASAGGGPTGAA
jgi:flagellar biogenesis protein FliO